MVDVLVLDVVYLVVVGVDLVWWYEGNVFVFD